VTLSIKVGHILSIPNITITLCPNPSSIDSKLSHSLLNTYIPSIHLVVTPFYDCHGSVISPNNDMTTNPISRDQGTVVMICLKDAKSLRPNEVYLFASFFDRHRNCILLKVQESSNGSKAPKRLISYLRNLLNKKYDSCALQFVSVQTRKSVLYP